MVLGPLGRLHGLPKGPTSFVPIGTGDVFVHLWALQVGDPLLEQLSDMTTEIDESRIPRKDGVI